MSSASAPGSTESNIQGFYVAVGTSKEGVQTCRVIGKLGRIWRAITGRKDSVKEGKEAVTLFAQKAKVERVRDFTGVIDTFTQLKKKNPAAVVLLDTSIKAVQDRFPNISRPDHHFAAGEIKQYARYLAKELKSGAVKGAVTTDTINKLLDDQRKIFLPEPEGNSKEDKKNYLDKLRELCLVGEQVIKLTGVTEETNLLKLQYEVSKRCFECRALFWRVRNRPFSVVFSLRKNLLFSSII